MEALSHGMAVMRNELLLFAVTGYLVFGFEEVIIDLLWAAEILKQRIFHASAFPSYVEDLRAPSTQKPIAVFIPAWKEHGVIADMLRHAMQVWGDGCYRLYVGCYRNDLATISRVLGLRAAQVRMVYHDTDGPTTKADCLNAIYRAMAADEVACGRFQSILLHDAEDRVHPAELQICRGLGAQFALVQLPVLPLRTRGTLWVGGHYLDEFSQSHSRDLTVRQTLGASIPSAGVGTILARDVLDLLSTAHQGSPFGVGSLTEDYELGLRIGSLGAPTRFLRIKTRAEGEIVATRAHFPADLEAATRQKTRWTFGIAFAAWDRLGWTQGFAENWMRLRDRRAVFAMLFLLSGYFGLLATLGLTLIGASTAPLPALQHGLLILTSLSLVWRLSIRALCVARHYGWREAMIAIPRIVTSNIVLILATHRAVISYRHFLRTGTLIWEKTAHKSPLDP